MASLLLRLGRIWPGAAGAIIGALLVAALVPLIDAEPATVATARGPNTGLDSNPATGNSPTASISGPQEATAPDGGGFIGGRDSGGDAGSGAVARTRGDAPTAAPSTGGPGADAGGSDASAPLTASDRGVTETTIKVAFLLLDLGRTGRIGINTTGVDPDQQQRAIEAYVQDLNERGGILGRTVEPFFRVFDATSVDDQRAACLAATEDAKAFAVVAMPGYANDAVLCVTEQQQAPLVITGQQVSREFYDRSAGRLMTLAMAGDRMMRNWAAELDDVGVLRGRTLGILSGDTKNARDTVEGVLVPALEADGHEVAHVSRFSADQATASSQIPTEIQRMRAAGVDTVLITISFLTRNPFVQAADRQGWRPQYLQSEFPGGTSDFEAQAMPESFDGALAMTSQRFGEWRSGVPESAFDARCREIYERASGEALPRNNGDQGNAGYATLLFPCGMLRVFAETAAAAGPELTRDRFVAAAQAERAVEPAYYFPGSTRPGKTDISDFVRFNRYEADCGCWKNVDQPRLGRFR